MGLLRLLLAAYVVVSHVPTPGNPPLLAYFAVELFFIISGFYMAMVLDTKYDKRTLRGISLFYANRFLRLWPVYIAITAGALLLQLAQYVYLGHPPASAAPFAEWLPTGAQAAIWATNLTMIGQDLPNLFHVNERGDFTLTLGEISQRLPDGSVWLSYARTIGQAWSLGTEIWFYLLAPFLLRLSGRSLALVFGALIAVRVVLESRFGFGGYFVFPIQLPLFIAGALAFRAFPRWPWLASLPFVALGICVVVLAGGSAESMLRWVCYALFAFGLPALFDCTRASGFDKIVGEQSYAVYLSHGLVVAVLALASKNLGWPVNAALVLSITLIVSYALYRYIEVPVGLWRERLVFTSRDRLRAPAPL